MIQPFFPETRRRVRLANIGPKLNAQDEARIKLDFEMALTGLPEEGMPSQVAEGFSRVSDVGKGCYDYKVELDLAPQTIEIYATEKARSRIAVIVAADLQKMNISRPLSETGAVNQVTLSFTTTVQFDSEIWVWGGDYIGKVFWCAYTAAQGVIREEETEAQGKLMQSSEAKDAVDSMKTKKHDGKAAGAGKD